MEERSKIHVGLDVHKDSISVAAAEPDRAPGRLIGKGPHDVNKFLKVLAKVDTTEQLHIERPPSADTNRPRLHRMNASVVDARRRRRRWRLQAPCTSEVPEINMRDRPLSSGRDVCLGKEPPKDAVLQSG